MADAKPKGTGAKKRSGSTGKKPTASTSSRSASARNGASASRTAGKPAAKRSTAKRSTSSSSGGAKSASGNGRAKSAASGSRAKASSNGSKRSAAASRSSTPARTSSSNGNHGIVDTAKDVAGKAKGPAIAVGAAAAGIAGGIVLKSRVRRKTVLGIPMPKHLPSVDAKSLAKTVGEASAQFAKSSKSVSKDIERAGDQAEKIGKILS